MQHLGTLGSAKAAGDVQEIRYPNRKIRWVSTPFGGNTYLEWEPDTRHTEILNYALGLKGSSKSLGSTGRQAAEGR
eukprot:2368289-Heterocapsa_arctica.AAC.1